MSPSMKFSQLVVILLASLVATLASRVGTRQASQSEEEDEELRSLDEQIRLRGAYGMLSDYLVERRTSADFKANIQDIQELIAMDRFNDLVTSDEFKRLARHLSSLDDTESQLCKISNLTHLRELAQAMQRHGGLKPTVGGEAQRRLNRLLIGFAKRLFGACLEPLQDEWSEVDFGMAHDLDPASRSALEALESEVDFVKVARNELKPAPSEEREISLDLLRVLRELILQAFGAEKSKEIVVSLRERINLAKHVENFLFEPCRQLEIHLSKQAGAGEHIEKYLDLIGIALAMYPQVLKLEEATNFQEIRVKGTGRMIICNKLLNNDTNAALVNKMHALARASAR